jgi:hypothetical protein
VRVSGEAAVRTRLPLPLPRWPNTLSHSHLYTHITPPQGALSFAQEYLAPHGEESEAYLEELGE